MITTILALIILTFQINFGDLDYPTMVISEHTNSMLSSAIVVFIFGLKVEMVDLLILVSLIYVEIISRLFQEIIPKVN